MKDSALNRTWHALAHQGWNSSRIEEVISVLWICAALLALIAGHRWLAGFFGIKAALDTYCTIRVGIEEIRIEREKEEARNRELPKHAEAKL